MCSIALARLRTDAKGAPGGDNSNAVGMAQKLLLFWRKPARRCWWEGVDLTAVEGVEGTLKVWVRRVWTLEMVSFSPRLRDRRDIHKRTVADQHAERDWVTIGWFAVSRSRGAVPRAWAWQESCVVARDCFEHESKRAVPALGFENYIRTHTVFYVTTW